MTLLGALHLGGRVLLAADSQVLAQHRPGIFVKEKADKIWRVPQMPDVIWGFSGDTDTGSRFGQWLNAQTASIWDDSCAAATEELARLNGDAHQLAQLAECERERVGVLVAGCPEGVASLVELHSDAGATKHEQSTAVFVGSGSDFGISAWRALARVLPTERLHTEQSLRWAMEAATETLLNLGGEISVLQTPLDGAAP